MQIGCPECKTESDTVATFDCIDKAAHLLDLCNKEIQRTGKKVEFQVFELPDLNVIPEYYRNK